MKIAVCNSVGIDKNGYYIIHSPSRWSWGQKNNKDAFTYYPWELAYTSSLLKRDTDFTIKMFDGCLNKWDVAAYSEILNEYQPDYIIMEPSARTIEEDKELMLNLKSKLKTKLIVAGPFASAFPKETSDWADFVCIGEYEYTVLDILRGEKEIEGLYPKGLRNQLDINTLPFPEDTDISRFDYAIPGEPNCEYTEIQAYASRGCPMKCNFCVCGNLYYKTNKWRPRNVEKIIEEIKYLKNKYPKMQGIFFDEEVHTGNKKFIIQLCEAIIENKLDSLKYNAMCGYFNLDEEMLGAMKQAGYYKLRIGIETADKNTAEQIGMLAKFNLIKLEEILISAKKIGLKIYGTFTIGAKGASYESDIETGNLLKDYVSRGLINDVQISINTPQPGTPFYKWADENGYLVTKDWLKYDGGNIVVVDRPDYPPAKVKKAFDYALRMYDEGLELREKVILKKIMIENLKKLNTEIKKIIILRSCRMWQINIFIDALKEIFNDCIIDIIAQPAVEKLLKNNNAIEKIFIYNTGFFNFDYFNEIFKSDFTNSDYDFSVVFYNNTTGYGFDEVNKIAKHLNNNVLEIYNNGTIKKQVVDYEKVRV